MLAGGFPARWLKLFAISHLFAGIIQVVLAFAQSGVTGRDDDELWVNPGKSRYHFYMFYAAFAIIFAGIMVRGKINVINFQTLKIINTFILIV